MQSLASPSCVDGCNFNKTSKHVFFDCPVFVKFWMNVLSWWKISCEMTNNLFIFFERDK